MKKINKEFLEKIIIKALMSDANFMSRIVDSIQPELFSQSSYNEVAKFYKDFWNKFTKIPSTAELKLYSSDAMFINNLKVVYEDIHSVNIQDIDRDILYSNAETFVKERLAMIALNGIVDKLQTGSINPSLVVDKFTQIAGISFLFDRGYNIYEDVDRYIDSLVQNKNRLPTGFTQIDKNINGGVLSDGKCLAIVTAPTNMGKSIMLGNIAVNAAKQGKNVLIISLEMSEEVYASRVYSNLYDLPINSLPLMGEELRNKIKENQYGKIIIKEFPPTTMTVDQIDSYIDSLYKAGHNFDLVCIDYLTLLYAPRSR